MKGTDFITLSQYERQEPIEGGRKEWVNYGEENTYPQYLHGLFMESVTHNALTYSIAQEFANSIVPPDIVEGHDNICLDIKKQGGTYLEINRSLLGTNIASVKHIPFECVRLGKDGDTAFYSNNWDNPRRKDKPVEYPIYKGELTDAVMILPVFMFVPGNDVYPKPDYIGAIDWVEMEKSIAKYHVENIRNGFSPLYAIKHHHNSEPTPEERNQNRKYYEKNLTGTEGSKIIITYDNGAENGVEFESFEITNEDEKYRFLSEECTNKIMIGHGVVNPQMFGVAIAGKLGGGTEIENSDELFKERKVDPVTRKLAEVYSMFGTVTTLSSDKEMSKDLEKYLIDRINTKGEVFDDEWDYFEEDIEDPLNEGVFHGKENLSSVAVKLFDSSYRNPEDKSEWGDAGLYKLRYFYSGGVSENTRDFCRTMVGLSDQGYVYRYEDIALGNKGSMSDEKVNRDFAPKGADTYDIFLHKGGVNCHHKWTRRIYFRKSDKGRFLPKSETPEMENDKRVGDNPYVPGKGREAVAPIDTPSKGRKLSKLIKKILGHGDTK